MTHQRPLFRVLLATAVAGLSGCGFGAQLEDQTAQAPTSVPVGKQAYQQKQGHDVVFGIEPAAGETVSDTPIERGGIFMRRNDVQEWSAPPREVDQLKEELAKLQNEVSGVKEDIDPLEASLQKMVQETDQKYAQRFDALASHMGEVKAFAIEQARNDAEKISEVKERFGQYEAALNALNAADEATMEQREALLAALDSKFSHVAAELERAQQAEEERLAAVEQKHLTAAQELEARLEALRAEKQQAEEIRLARLEGEKEGREKRFLEELEFRKTLQEARRQQVLAEAREAKAREEAAVAAQRERDLALAKREAAMREELAQMETRRQDMQAMLESRLSDMQRDHDNKVLDLQKQKDAIDTRLSALAHEDQFTREQLELQRGDVLHQLQKLDDEMATQQAQSEEYRKAIEERIFSMQKSTDPYGMPVATETIDGTQMAYAKVDEGSDVGEARTVSDTPTATITGVIKGSTNPADWIALKDYHVVVHADNRRLGELVADVMLQAEPYVGPWEVKWKLDDDVKDVINERFSLDAETTFDAFAGYLSNFMQSYRGFGLTFNIFETERILVITN